MKKSYHKIPAVLYKRHLIAGILFLLFFINQFVCAQTVSTAFNLNYIPPSPNSVALGKFGEVPVSLSTGVPSISVPLFSYRGPDNGLSLNVGLDYHAGGVRVEEIAGNVGLGWALSCGGVVSRTMRGLPDDLPSYGYVSVYPLPVPTYTPGGANTNLDNYIHNAVDAEQDEFNFNFNGHAGKFILDGSRNPILISKASVKIQPLYASGTTLPFSGFMITDETGTKYIFKDQETTSGTFSTYRPAMTYTSSWYISAIVSPTSKDTIKFTYNTVTNNIYNLSSESASNLYTSGLSLSTTTVYSTPAGTNTSMSGKRIKKIVFPDQTEIDFLYNSLSRCDLKGDSTLTEVRQKNTVTGQYQSYKLYQSYIDQYGIKYAYTSPPCDLSNNTNATNVRMRLDSVKQTGGTSSVKPYQFVYNDAYYLPPTNSLKQDFWGYFNGTVNSAGHLAPQMLYNDPTSGTSYMLPGGDRRADSNAVSASALIKMIYPTGGYSQFDFEANRAGDNKLIFNYVKFNTVTFDANEDQVKAFTLNNSPDNQAINFSFNMTTWCPGTPTSCSFVFKIKSADNTTTYATETFAYGDVGTHKIYPLSLPNGNYNLTWAMQSPGTCSCTDQFGFSLTFNSSAADSSQMGGGIRVKRITNYDGVSHTNDVIKQYKYIDSYGKSTGYAANIPAFTHPFTDCTYNPGGGDGGTVVLKYNLVRTATTNYPLTFSTGGINYAMVETDETGPVNNGKELDYFTSYKNYAPKGHQGSLFSFPFVPMQAQDWFTGLLTTQQIYDNSGHILKKVNNTYTLFTPDALDTLSNYKIGAPRVNDCGAPSNITPSNGSSAQTLYTTNGYSWLVSRSEKTQTTMVDYTAAGDSLVSTTYYTTNPTWYTASKELTIDSKGDSVAAYHYYPFDYNITGSVFSAMRDSNIISRPVSTEIWKYLSTKYYLISADATSYALYGASYLPSKYYLLTSVQPVDPSVIGTFSSSVLLRVPSLYDQKINFSNYDSKGNPVLISQHGALTAYVWDVNKEKPIAKVANADSLTVAYTSFELDGPGNWTIGSALRDTTTAITGKRSYNLINGSISFSGLSTARTYVVSYWSRNGSYTLTNGGTPKTGATINGWTYYEHAITATGAVTISGSGNIDELRLYPQWAQMSTYTYDALLGITSTADVKNQINYYEYDGLLRLKNIKDQNGNIIKHTDYHYQGQ